MPAPELCFVLAPGQNHFFVEVVEALTFELEQLGVPVAQSRAGFPPPRDDLVYVLVPPHEFRGLAPRSHWPTPRQLERTVFYCLEQPGTTYFDADVQMGKGPVGAVLDINAVSVREQRRRGVWAHHAPLGWTAAWSHADPTGSAPSSHAVERDVDLLHLGIYSARRGAALARSARELARWRSVLVLGDDHGPNAVGQDNFAIDRDKWELLARSRALLNIHVGERSYFEWLRVVQAICNGVLVVSEHSTGTAPLQVGEHFVSGRADALAQLAEPFLEDEALRAKTTRDAALFLRETQPLRQSAQRLAELAADVARRPAGSPRARQGGLMLGDPDGDAGVEEATTHARVVALHGLAEAPDVPNPYDGEDPDSLRAPWPDNTGVAEAIAAAARTPGGLATAPPAPSLQLGRAKPAALGELVLLTRPVVELHATGVERLEAVLAGDANAAFAWGMLAREGSDDGDEEPALSSVFPWQPWRLDDGSYIERPVLWRGAALRDLGFSGEEPPSPSEDLGLYRAAAERGLSGRHLPEIVAFQGQARRRIVER